MQPPEKKDDVQKSVADSQQSAKPAGKKSILKVGGGKKSLRKVSWGFTQVQNFWTLSDSDQKQRGSLT